MKLRFSAIVLAVNALALGASPDLETAAKQLEGGDVDVYWGGPMRIMLATTATLATLLAVEAWTRGEIDVRSLDTPRWLLFLPLIVGFGLMGTEFLRLLVRGESLAGGQRADTF